MRIGFAHNRVVLAAVLLLTAFALTRIDDVGIDVSADSLSAPGSAAARDYEAAREQFGSDLVLGFYVADDRLFDPEKLELLALLNRELSALPQVERCESLFSLPDLRDTGGAIETSPLLAELPSTAEEAEALRQAAASHPLFARNVVSADGRAMLFNLYLRPGAEEADARDALLGRLDRLIADYGGAFDRAFVVGSLIVQQSLLDQIKVDQWRILPLAVVLLFVLFAATSRSLLAGVIPLLNALIASLWSLAWMSLLGIPVNLLNYILPILILVVGAAADVHILHEFKASIARGGDADEAVGKASERIWRAVFLTALTTLLGFLSTTLSDLPVLRQFGVAAFLGLGSRFLLSVFFLPALLALFLPWVRNQRGAVESLSEGLSRRLLELTVSRVNWIVPVMILLAVVSALLASRIQSSNDLLSFIDPDSEVRVRHDEVAARMSGLKVLYVTLEGGSGRFTEAHGLAELERVARGIGELRGVDATFSFADVVARIHQQLRGGGADELRIPDNTPAIRQMMLFVDPASYRSFLNRDQSHANIVVRSSLGNSTELNRLGREIGDLLDDLRGSGITATVTGRALLVAGGVDSVISTQVFSLGAMTLILFVIVGLLFVSLKCAAISVCVNLFAAAIVFGFMGLAGIPLNVGTCMVAAVTLGIVIDDTLHLLVRFSQCLRSTRDERAGMQAALREEITPVTVTSVGLAGGFLSLALSGFVPVQQFGVLSAMVILIALVVDLGVTPMLFACQRIVTLWDAIGLKVRDRLIKESPLFEGLSSWQARRLILASELQDFRAGEWVIRAGETGTRMYMVLEGQVEVSRRHLKGIERIANLRTGDIFGEVACISHVPRSADVKAVTDGRLLALDFPALVSLRRFSPYMSSRLLLNISRILGERLAATVVRYKSDYTI